MRMRQLGRTGLNVSECTFGTAALLRGDHTEAAAALALALERGVSAIEIHAGDDDVVALVSEVLAREGAQQRVHVLVRPRAALSMDLPSPHIMAHHAYPGERIRRDVDTMLQRLGVERLGIVHLHAWCPEWLGEGDWQETLSRLKQEGKIAGSGVSLFDHDLDTAVTAAASGAFDTVQVMHNIFDQGALRRLLPLCEQRGIGVIVRSPLYYGMLAATPSPRTFAPGDWRRDFFYDQHLAETMARVDRLRSAFDQPIAELALRFSLSHPAVSTVAVGMRTREQVEANLAAISRGPLTPQDLERLAAHRWLC